MNITVALLIALFCLPGCTKNVPRSSASAPTTAPAQDNSAASSVASAPAESSQTKQELQMYAQRRRPKPAVIGGCAEACDSPSKAIELFFDALQAADRDVRLRPLFDWSILRVDDEEKGNRWADMWGQPRKRAQRDKEIDAWLHHWSKWVDRIAESDSLVRAKMSGVELRPLPGRQDVIEVAFRHPKLKDDTTERQWRLYMTLRGYEWLISRIDHRPSEAKNTRPPRGSAQPGRL